jgi:two-component system chemotaxis sensor kinase CheA
MGLSVVQQAVNLLQGDISVQSRAGEGTSISLSVPLSISTQHVLLVSLGSHTFAFPTAMIEQLCRLERENIRVVDGKEVVVIDSKPVPLVSLAEVLKLPQPSESAEPLQLIIVASHQEFHALVVDRLLDEREAIVEDPGLPEDGTGFSAGAIALEDGTVAVMLNVGKVLSNFSVRDKSNIRFLADASKEKKAHILVVDDSVTIRSLEKRILEAHGYEVELAVDGLEALEKVHAREPDLIISDVNMPRMDGFQLLEQIKTTKKTSHLPMILVTSLESREEQEQGLSLGADAYIVKRKFDQRELLEIIHQIL